MMYTRSLDFFRFSLIVALLGLPLGHAAWSQGGVPLPPGAHLVTLIQDAAGVARVVDDKMVSGSRRLRLRGGGRFDSFPRVIVEEAPLGGETVIEVIGASLADVRSRLSRKGLSFDQASLEAAVAGIHAAKDTAADEVRTLLNSGPSENRIDLVFMGDGYTAQEKEKFFADISRILNELFGTPTFRPYRPLFNVHAVFRASQESGLGRGSPRDTAYRLYRQGNTLRAIFCGDSSAARASSHAAPDCDYPVLIANDPYYGGLGGEFAISTASPTSGTMVLRHELGHNFGRVGEEYDGGGYFGANTASRLSSIGWSHWLTGDLEAASSKARFLDWPWHNLQDGAYTAKFKSDGQYAYRHIAFSASGIVDNNDLVIELDGEPVAFNAPGYPDRAFHELFLRGGFSDGNHKLVFRESAQDGDNWVSSLTVHEYGEHFVFDDSFVGAFPLYSQGGSVAAYRSNWETCLMRHMQSDRFCDVCIENIWLKFLDNVSLIDAVDVAEDGDQVTVSLSTVPLGAQRPSALAGESIQIVWIKDGVEVESLNGLLSWTGSRSDVAGSYVAQVTLVTPQVRKDPRGLLKDLQAFRID